MTQYIYIYIQIYISYQTCKSGSTPSYVVTKSHESPSRSQARGPKHELRTGDLGAEAVTAKPKRRSDPKEIRAYCQNLGGSKN